MRHARAPEVPGLTARYPYAPLEQPGFDGGVTGAAVPRAPGGGPAPGPRSPHAARPHPGREDRPVALVAPPLARAARWMSALASTIVVLIGTVQSALRLSTSPTSPDLPAEGAWFWATRMTSIPAGTERITSTDLYAMGSPFLLVLTARALAVAATRTQRPRLGSGPLVLRAPGLQAKLLAAAALSLVLVAQYVTDTVALHDRVPRFHIRALGWITLALLLLVFVGDVLTVIAVHQDRARIGRGGAARAVPAAGPQGSSVLRRVRVGAAVVAVALLSACVAATSPFPGNDFPEIRTSNRSAAAAAVFDSPGEALDALNAGDLACEPGPVDVRGSERRQVCTLAGGNDTLMVRVYPDRASADQGIALWAAAIVTSGSHYDLALRGPNWMLTSQELDEDGWLTATGYDELFLAQAIIGGTLFEPVAP